MGITAQEGTPLVHDALLHQGELGELLIIHAVVAEGVIALVHTFDAVDGVAGDVEGYEAGRIGGEGHVHDVEEDALHGDFVVARHVRGRLQ
jgi:hypothetical protein